MTALQRLQLGIKRVLDISIVVVALLLLSPLFALIAAAIKMEDGGPVFFRQQRLGRNASVFSIWKFRSMLVNADEFIGADGQPTQDRITKMGRFLRISSLDEIPQLLNILSGDMAIVGPRPALLAHYPRYSLFQRRRLELRPGVTGLAQVNGRNTLPWSQRIQYDVDYIDGYSLWLDVVIVLRTVIQVLFRRGIVMDRNPGDVDDLGPPQAGVELPRTAAKRAESSR